MFSHISHKYCFILHSSFGWIFLSILELLKTLKHVISVVNTVKDVEFGHVVAGEKHSLNPPLLSRCGCCTRRQMKEC